ncbi:RHS Repeat family protein [Escherichia coli DEC10A]|nr:RHS Repeat family protein [Escherichia coli DEC10A]
MEYDAAGRVIRLTSENGSHTTFRYDVLDRLIQETGFDGRTQRYHHDLTGKLIRSEDEGLVTHWHYDEADRLTHRTVKGETAERWRYDERGWLTDISHISEGHRVTVHYGYDRKAASPVNTRRCITRRRKHCSGSMRPDMRTTRRDWRNAVYRTACPPWNG